MMKALTRTRYLLDPPIYLSPMKRWRRLSPYLSGLVWVTLAGVCVYAYATEHGAL